MSDEWTPKVSKLGDGYFAVSLDDDGQILIQRAGARIAIRIVPPPEATNVEIIPMLTREVPESLLDQEPLLSTKH
jgi:hypothetical protein